MTAHLRADFEQVNQSVMTPEEKAKRLFNVVSVCDPHDENDRMTVYNLISNVGVFEQRAIEMGLYTVKDATDAKAVKDVSGFELPRAGGIVPVMTVAQAARAIEFLKTELADKEKPVFFYGPYDRCPTLD